ncbi:MAG TPA: carboxylesterase family protein, partial [Pirellulales bacterium]|nr:carboxylesterase family protein [Pirellulales bacterium]
MNKCKYSFLAAVPKDLDRRVFLQETCRFAAGAAASLVLPLGARHSLNASAATPETTSDVADTAHGKVRGAVVNGISVFKGLTYGASTSGPNRFMPPQKPESWIGVRDAFEFGPISPQRAPKGSAAALAASIYAPDKPASIFAYPAGVPDREDCLVLDVYTPSVTDRRPRPVLVWLHGGGFSKGSASAPVYDGTNLAHRSDVVVVGINHRLNVLGYAYLAELG